MTDPKAMEAARRIKEHGIPPGVPMSFFEDAFTVARALLAGEGPVPEVKATYIAARLRRTTEAMANQCRVDQTLWNDHSNACLNAAHELDRLSSPSPAVRDVTLREALIELVIDRLHDYRAHGSIDFPDNMPQELAQAMQSLSHPSLPDGGKP